MWRATNSTDRIANQTLRSTLSVEQVIGPDWRMTVDASGVARAMTSRWPVTQILGAQYAPRVPPYSWTPIPVSAVVPEEPPMTLLSPVVEGASGAGGNAVLVAPGYVSWFGGRNGYVLELAYLNGWPHAGITATVAEGATTVTVNDVTGMAGATCFLYDGAATETVTVSTATATTPVTLPMGGTAQAGPGTLALAAATVYEHQAGTIISALPQDIIWATILLAAAQVLSEGATAVAIPDIAGALTSGGKGVEDLVVDAEVIISSYHRVILQLLSARGHHGGTVAAIPGRRGEGPQGQVQDRPAQEGQARRPQGPRPHGQRPQGLGLAAADRTRGGGRWRSTPSCSTSRA